MRQKNLIARKENPKDRRKVEIVLTDLGQFIYQKVVRIQKDEIRSVLDALDSQDMINAKEILEKINNALVIKERLSE